MKKLISILLAVCMILSLVSCIANVLPEIPEEEAEPPPEENNYKQEQIPTPTMPPVDTDEVDMVGGKILLFTAAIGSNFEYDPLYTYARTVVELYPDRTIHLNVPKEFSFEGCSDLWIENSMQAIEAELICKKVNVFIFLDYWIEHNPIFAQRISELRPDIFIIELLPSAFMETRYNNYIAIGIELSLIGRAIQQAKLMGVENLVFYVDVHPATGEIANKYILEIVREECKNHEIKLIEQKIRTPVRLDGHIVEDIGIWGRNTMFFSNLFVASIDISFASISAGALAIPAFPAPDMSNFLRLITHPVFFGDYDWQQEKLIEFLEEHDAIGRLAVWRIPFAHISLIAAVEYAIGYMDGVIESKTDYDALYECFRRGFELLGFPDTHFELSLLEGYDNVFLFLQEYVVF